MLNNDTQNINFVHFVKHFRSEILQIKYVSSLYGGIYIYIFFLSLAQKNTVWQLNSAIWAHI